MRMSGTPAALLMKPDGGELYVSVPSSHGLEIIDTWRTEISESMILGSAPTDGTMTGDASLVYVSDASANSVTPIEMATRHLLPPILTGRHPGPCALDPSGDLLLVANEDSRGRRRDPGSHAEPDDDDSRRLAPKFTRN